MKNKGPNMTKWREFRHGDNEVKSLDENFLGVKTMIPMNRNSPELQENARKIVAQIEHDLTKITELLQIVNKGLNEGKVPDSKVGNGIMELALNVGAFAARMWK